MYFIRANSRDNFSGGETHRIERFFTRVTGEMNDVALVLLKTRIEKHVSVTFLRPDAFVHSGTEVVTFGWGEADYNTWPRYLRMVTMNITDASKCRKEYPGTNWICTGEKNLSNCVISPGSPTHINGWLMGIVSLGGNKSQSRTPIANVNLRKYWKWIESYIKDQQYA
ncbi:hypothetical protein QAD02_018635 [Eretmocerus hayati]|uniref:Uncharacterized protein n=1 Tax=Eretmocerus hayati TaxID=131215 RepID=A0ACC2PII0_9HYME|nr:hypothetical protein QAD02_018635 [Eretmocerus hayati]